MEFPGSSMRARSAFLLVALSLAVSALSAPVNAGPALLFEPSNGKVLYAEDPDDLWHPASLTKIMTAYVTFEAIKQGKLKLTDKIKCSLVSTLQPPSKVGMNVGDTLTVEQALKAVIIKSANDVTVMLAEAVSGSEAAFVEQMNATARRLGMTRTSFVNTNGLPDPGQITTARDLAKLARVVVDDYPEYASYWTMPDMRIGKRRLQSHNGLLKTFEGADGLKTGFTCDSGYNIIASATRDGHRLMAIVLGESSGGERTVRAAALLEHGFQNYTWKQLFNSSTIDTLPSDPAAKGISSVRTTVASWDCNPHKRHKNKTANRKTLKAKQAAVNAKKKSDDTASAKARPQLKGSDTGPPATNSAGTTAPKAAEALAP